MSHFPVPDPFTDQLALQQEIVRLQALLDVSRRLHSTIDLKEVVRSTLEIVAKELEADGAFFTPSPALAGLDTVYGSVGLNALDESHSASVPLLNKNGEEFTRLVILRDSRPLSMEEQDFLDGIGLQSGVAIENAHYHEQSLKWERVQQDLAAARAIQHSLLPNSIPRIPGYIADFRMNPCYEVGGDYLDILTLPTGNLVMVVADVAGKGLASALVSASFRSAFRAMAVAGVPLEEAASRLNELHCGESSETRQRYVTAMFLRLDPSEHRIEVVNAGHNPGFLCNPSGYYKLLEASGPPVGLLSGMQYQTEEFQLEPGGRVMLYTDGLVEVFRGGEEFGMERLFRRFQNFPMAAFRSMLQNIWAELADFASSPDPSDDMTALALLRTDAVEAFA